MITVEDDWIYVYELFTVIDSCWTIRHTAYFFEEILNHYNTATRMQYTMRHKIVEEIYNKDGSFHSYTVVSEYFPVKPNRFNIDWRKEGF